VDADRRIQTVCLLILTAIALGAALQYLSPVLIPFVLAIFLTYCLAPIIDAQVHYLKIRRGVALVTTILLGCVLLVGAWHLLWESIEDLAPRLMASAGEQTVEPVEPGEPGETDDTDEIEETGYADFIDQLIDQASERLPLEQFNIERDQLRSLLSLPSGSVQGMVGGLFGAIMGFLSNGLLVIIFMIFMIAGKAGPPVPPESLRGQIEARVKQYLSTKVLISALTGIAVGVTLTVLQVPFALAFGVLAFLMNFIPNIGSVIATLLPLPVVLFHPEVGKVAAILAIAIPGGLQFAVGNLIEPKIMGGSLGLHPIVILMGLIFFGMIWGIIGMFLATPIVAVIKIILERIEVTRPAAQLLEGKWVA
jgi:AI-2 transport protein TqsA